MANQPDDSWNKLLLRIKQAAIEECHGVSVMSVKIIMRERFPVGWTVPLVQRYEGKVRNDLLESLIETLDMTGMDVV